MIIGKALIVPPPPGPNKILDKNTWKTIKQVADKSQGPNYWAVGDCKQITMNGKVSDGLTLTNFETYVYILGFNHNEALEGSGIVFGGFKTAQTDGIDVCLVDSEGGSRQSSGTWCNMNNTATNEGGWGLSQMRKNIMPLIKAAFPADLQAVIKPSTIFTTQGPGNGACTATQDEVFLLAEYEIFGSKTKASTQEQNYLKQYSYYAAGNSKVKYEHNRTMQTQAWWERSPYANSSDYFCRVGTSGEAYGASADYTIGVAPAFKV